MNREFELINFLKQPVRCKTPPRWNKIVPANIRWVHKPYGGRGRGRWIVFKDFELPPHKGFSDALVATLAAKALLMPFSKDSSRTFFLRECVSEYVKDRDYVFELAQEIEAYKRF